MRVTFSGVVYWIPLAAYLCLFSFAAIAYLRKGHWPFYGHPDPSHLRLPLLYAASVLAYPLALIGMITGLVSLVVAPQRWRRYQAGVLLLGSLAWGLSVVAAGRLVPWLLD